MISAGNCKPGRLYVVATPLGNLEDISARALRLLGEVDVIAAEDTRHSRKLLAHYGIRTTMTSYYDEVEAAKAPSLVRELLAGRDVALISDAGTPGIADPGYRLVRAAAEAGIEVVAVPGPCAAIAALSVSGLPTDRFAFEGFLPGKASRRRARLEELRREARTLVFYEAPHRVRRALQDMHDILGPRQVAVLREATKMFESVTRGRLGSLSAEIPERGEVTIVVAGAPAEEDISAPADLDAEIDTLLGEGVRTREVAERLAGAHHLPRREVYRRVLARSGRRPEGA